MGHSLNRQSEAQRIKTIREGGRMETAIHRSIATGRKPSLEVNHSRSEQDEKKI